MLILGLVGCDKNKETSDDAGINSDETTKKVTLIVNGNLGDLGFFDSAHAGLKRLKEEKNVDFKIIETGADESRWEPALADAAEDDESQIIIAVSPSMIEPVQKIAPQYPEKKFFLIDNAVDFEKYDLPNVYCATFKQNEGSFLAGVVAASGAYGEDANTIGFLGGQDIPPINDFLVGFIEGAKYVNDGVKVVIAYAGDYYNPAKGKELGLVMFNQGAQVVFPAAGPTSLGTIEAAVQVGKFIIGVDNDQSSLYLNNGDEKTADAIVTSMMKNIGDAIYRAVSLDLEGKLPYGQSEALGFKEGGVGLAMNSVFEKAISQETKDLLAEVQEKISNGEIVVSTAIGMDDATLAELKQSVAP